MEKERIADSHRNSGERISDSGSNGISDGGLRKRKGKDSAAVNSDIEER